MGGLSTDFGNPWWTKPFVGDAYSVVYQHRGLSGETQFVSAPPCRERPDTNPKWRQAAWDVMSEYRDIAIIKWRWK